MQTDIDKDIAALEQVWQQVNECQRHREAVSRSGLPALARLVVVAQGHSGQSAVVGRFLLGLYNGPEYPLDLTSLRALDLELHNDCLAVLAMDWSPEREVHELIENGPAIWRAFVKRWG
ncbi:hypothetical protein ACFSB1_00355 [Halopseudomonas phragmitis]|uniref:DUF7673 domain-containing protein n=1 Tax=Halopseudomonas phragmitis TaxID=1931241 RepID=A0A1V0B695_9GAMM|nr:hypothetical protein [Halopseudomonas phragmitis]AQZ95437.1 hypothetical protein BVH74_12060 [Halopseudomonas phragmitis]